MKINCEENESYENMWEWTGKVGACVRMDSSGDWLHWRLQMSRTNEILNSHRKKKPSEEGTNCSTQIVPNCDRQKYTQYGIKLLNKVTLHNVYTTRHLWRFDFFQRFSSEEAGTQTLKVSSLILIA